MELANRRCKSCGGDLIDIGGQKYKCDSCGNVYYSVQQTDEERIALETAYNSLRQGNFEAADEAFDLVVKRFPRSYEAYWGALLSKNGVVYVDDVLENKKVPTCYNTILTSFLSDTLYKKALEFAPKEVKENYIKQAEKIEKIREEWCEKASKEQPYDVFICFKDSDRENNIDRTRDSVDAAEIYHHLSKKYRVFFSRETLRGKVAEQYEPYIFNALKTAQVMIVFGSKAEYMNSTWVKNEWSRYIKRIKSGEKQANSLVVAYKDMDAYDIPKQLSGGRQCIDAKSFTFLTDLDSHIEKVLEVLNAKSKIERVKIESVAVGKKVSAVEVQKIVTREFGNISLNSLTATEEGALQLAEKMMKAKKYDEAAKIYERQYQQNSKNARAAIGLTYARCNVANIEEFSRLDTEILAKAIDSFENAIAGLDEASAVQLLGSFSDGRLEVLNGNRKKIADDKKIVDDEELEDDDEDEDSVDMADDDEFAHIFNVIAKFKFPKLTQYIQANLEYAKKNCAIILFDSALAALQNPDPDFHIENLLSIARTMANITGFGSSEITSLCDRVLAIDEHNARARWLKFLEKYHINLARATGDFAMTGRSINAISDVSEIDDVLKYCNKKEYRQLIGAIVDKLCDEYKDFSCRQRVIALFDQIIKRITDKEQLVKSLTKFGNVVMEPIAKEFNEVAMKKGKAAAEAKCSFDDAKKYFALAINQDEADIGARKGLLAAACKVASFEDIANSRYRISQQGEYEDLMIAAQVAKADTLLNELIALPDRQKPESDVIKEEKELLASVERIETQIKQSKFKRQVGLLFSAAVALAAIITLFFFEPQGAESGPGLGDVGLGVSGTCFITALLAITYFIFAAKRVSKIRNTFLKGLFAVFMSILLLFQLAFTVGGWLMPLQGVGTMGVMVWICVRCAKNNNSIITLIIAFCWIILQLVFLCIGGSW